VPNAFGDLFKPQMYWHYTALENVPAIFESGGLDPAKNKFSALDKGGRQAIFSQAEKQFIETSEI
jgi:hypothetical protein